MLFTELVQSYMSLCIVALYNLDYANVKIFCSPMLLQTDDLEGRVRAHRMKEGMQKVRFLYFTVPGKSLACQLETLLINQLPNQGFHLTNIADGKHRNFGTSNLALESVSVR